MLRSEHTIIHYDFRRFRAEPDRLRRGRDDDYLLAAKVLLRLYRDGVGRSRQSIHRDVEETLARLPACPPRRIVAFCKLLDDLATYQTGKNSAFQLRQKVFVLAASMHPIVQTQEGIFEHTLEQARKSIGETIGLPWKQIEGQLFSDVIELQTLQSFDNPLTPQQLLSNYNVAQTQAALYRATRIRVDAYQDFKTILKHAKLAGLMHRITKLEGHRSGYRFEFDGPATSLRESTRYGIRYASMLPKLLACRDWSMIAKVVGPRQQSFRLTLSPQDGLNSVLETPDEFDSELEQDVWKAWNGSPVEGWTIQRESELLCHGQSVFTPDFVLGHPATKRKIFIEVIGFWTPEYLTEKCRRLDQFVTTSDRRRWLLMYPKSGAKDRQALFASLGIPCIVFGKQSKPKDWIDVALL